MMHKKQIRVFALITAYVFLGWADAQRCTLHAVEDGFALAFSRYSQLKNDRDFPNLGDFSDLNANIISAIEGTPLNNSEKTSELMNAFFALASTDEMQDEIQDILGTYRLSDAKSAWGQLKWFVEQHISESNYGDEWNKLYTKKITNSNWRVFLKFMGDIRDEASKRHDLSDYSHGVRQSLKKLETSLHETMGHMFTTTSNIDFNTRATGDDLRFRLKELALIGNALGEDLSKQTKIRQNKYEQHIYTSLEDRLGVRQEVPILNLERREDAQIFIAYAVSLLAAFQKVHIYEFNDAGGGNDDIFDGIAFTLTQGDNPLVSNESGRAENAIIQIFKIIEDPDPSGDLEGLFPEILSDLEEKKAVRNWLGTLRKTNKDAAIDPKTLSKGSRITAIHTLIDEWDLNFSDLNILAETELPKPPIGGGGGPPPPPLEGLLPPPVKSVRSTMGADFLSAIKGGHKLKPAADRDDSEQATTGGTGRFNMSAAFARGKARRQGPDLNELLVDAQIIHTLKMKIMELANDVITSIEQNINISLENLSDTQETGIKASDLDTLNFQEIGREIIEILYPLFILDEEETKQKFEELKEKSNLLFHYLYEKNFTAIHTLLSPHLSERTNLKLELDLDLDPTQPIVWTEELIHAVLLLNTLSAVADNIYDNLSAYQEPLNDVMKNELGIEKINEFLKKKHVTDRNQLTEFYKINLGMNPEELEDFLINELGFQEEKVRNKNWTEIELQQLIEEKFSNDERILQDLMSEEAIDSNDLMNTLLGLRGEEIQRIMEKKLTIQEIMDGIIQTQNYELGENQRKWQRQRDREKRDEEERNRNNPSHPMLFNEIKRGPQRTSPPEDLIVDLGTLLNEAHILHRLKISITDFSNNVRVQTINGIYALEKLARRSRINLDDSALEKVDFQEIGQEIIEIIYNILLLDNVEAKVQLNRYRNQHEEPEHYLPHDPALWTEETIHDAFLSYALFYVASNIYGNIEAYQATFKAAIENELGGEKVQEILSTKKSADKGLITNYYRFNPGVRHEEMREFMTDTIGLTQDHFDSKSWKKLDTLKALLEEKYEQDKENVQTFMNDENFIYSDLIEFLINQGIDEESLQGPPLNPEDIKKAIIQNQASHLADGQRDWRRTIKIEIMERAAESQSLLGDIVGGHALRAVGDDEKNTYKRNLPADE